MSSSKQLPSDEVLEGLLRALLTHDPAAHRSLVGYVYARVQELAAWHPAMKAGEMAHLEHHRIAAADLVWKRLDTTERFAAIQEFLDAKAAGSTAQGCRSWLDQWFNWRISDYVRTQCGRRPQITPGAPDNPEADTNAPASGPRDKFGSYAPRFDEAAYEQTAPAIGPATGVVLDDVKRHLDTFDKKDRAIMWKKLAGASYEEIAAETGEDVDTIERRVRALKGRLRDKFRSDS